MCYETYDCANVSPSPQPSPIKGEGVKTTILRKSYPNLRSAYLYVGSIGCCLNSLSPLCSLWLNSKFDGFIVQQKQVKHTFIHGGQTIQILHASTFVNLVNGGVQRTKLDHLCAGRSDKACI